MNVEVFGRTIPRASRVEFRTKVAEQNDGSDVTIPVMAIGGAGDGPRLVLMGAQHGDEYSGWNVMRAVFAGITPERLRGTLVGLPITNPFAFFGESRVNKLDYEFLNLNRIWPGNPEGFLSQRMAHVIFDQCLRRATHIIDFHEGGRDFLARYMIIGGTEEIRAKVQPQEAEMARWFGQGIPIYDTHTTEAMTRLGRWGMVSEAAAHLGIPVLVPEIGGGGRVWDNFQTDGVRGTRNVMIGLGMLDGTMEGNEAVQHMAPFTTWARPSHGGFLINRVDLGAVVAEGDPLGDLLDPYGKVVETLQAPFRAVIMDTRFTTAMHPGDWAFHCGRLS